MILKFTRWTVKIANDLSLLYQFLTNKHWIYNEREVLINKQDKPRKKNNGSVVIVIQDKSELKQFLSDYIV